MHDTKAICWDVYGTLIAAKRGDLDSLVRRENELRTAFADTIRHFQLRASAEELHRNFLRAIVDARAAKVAAGIPHPEIRIEEIWLGLIPGCPARDVAQYFEHQANPKQLMPGAHETLRAIKDRGYRQGIISNAQFYTPIELDELLAGNYPTLFDSELTFFSCDLGVAKPDLTAFRRMIEVLARNGITPDECIYVGDSLVNDIAPAREVGIRTVHFGPTGDIQQLPQLLERL